MLEAPLPTTTEKNLEECVLMYIKPQGGTEEVKRWPGRWTLRLLMRFQDGFIECQKQKEADRQ